MEFTFISLYVFMDEYLKQGDNFTLTDFELI
jgi:hypothetical protein